MMNATASISARYRLFIVLLVLLSTALHFSLAAAHGIRTATPLAAADPDTSYIPDPNLSTFQDRLGRSPKNSVVPPMFQYTYRGRLVMANGMPLPNWPANDIELHILAPCQNPVVLHPDGPSGPAGEVVWGAAKLQVAGGGSCIGSTVATVRLQSVGLFKSLNEVTSPDEDGIQGIALADLSTFQQAFVSGGPRYQGDLNLGDGPPDLADLAFFQHHFTAL